MPALQGLLSIALVLLIINTCAAVIKKQSASPLNSEFFKWSFVFGSIYALGAVGSSNTSITQFDIIQKSTVAVLGFMLICGNMYHPLTLIKAQKYFILSNIATFIVCVILASLRYVESNNVQDFFYTGLSVFLHPGYFSMYLSLCLAFLFKNLNKEDKLFRSNQISWILISIIFTAIYLLSSKSGIISGLLISLVFSIITLRRKVLSKKIMRLGFLLSLLILVAILIPTKTNRLNSIINDLETFQYKKDYELNTSGQRIFIWQAAIRVIKENFWLGTGVGNENKALLKQLELEDHQYLLLLKPNAHNQFLQVFMTLGIGGFLFFTSYIFLPLYLSLKRKDILLLSFSIIIIVNALTESIFNRQAGILFWTVWGFLLIESNSQKVNLTTVNRTT